MCNNQNYLPMRKIIVIALLLARCVAMSGGSVPRADAVHIPMKGNLYVTSGEVCEPSYSEDTSGILTLEGDVRRWDAPSTVLSAFFKCSRTGEFKMWITGTAGASSAKSKIKVSVDGKSHTVKLKGGEKRIYDAGTFRVKTPGYVKVDFMGESKTGDVFGEITTLTVEGDAVDGEMHFAADRDADRAFWIRRGPAAHLHYAKPQEDIEYFYNEVTVPEGCDVNGTYFMLTGFAEGYMGIQSITAPDGSNGNLVLFSVWSPFKTDNPGDIPEDSHVKVLSVGEGVTARDFGHEGSGKQSFMHYEWKPGNTYRTLVRVRPDGDGNTVYTGYFCDENGTWHLLSSLLRPKTDTWYMYPHSFLECFLPWMSYKPRSVNFSNQWMRDKNGQWHEIVDSAFTCDDTGRSGARTDVNGGLNGDSFFLQHCGFVDATTPYGANFHRKRKGAEAAPHIDFEALEKLAQPQ